MLRVGAQSCSRRTRAPSGRVVFGLKPANVIHVPGGLSILPYLDTPKKIPKLGLSRNGLLALMAVEIALTQRDGLATRKASARLSGGGGTVLVERR